MKYSIYEGYMPELEKKMARIRKKCERYGCRFSFEITGEDYRKITDPDGNDHTMRFVIIEVDGNAIINDWEFIGSVEHTPKGNIIRKAMAGVEVPERYRESDPYCEHCNTRRRRNETYIIHNIKTGEFKQVGKSCLKDYTRGYDANLAAEMLAMREIFQQYEEMEIGGSYYSSNVYNYINKMDALKLAIEVIDKFGYCKADSDYSTKDRMLEILFIHRLDIHSRKRVRQELDAVGFDANREGNDERAEKILNWIKKEDNRNDYMNNLKVVSKLDYVTARQIGILASLVPTYNRTMERNARIKAQKNQDAKSGFVGNLRDRISIDVKDCRIVTSWESSYNGYDVVMTFLYKFTDANDNIYIWKTSKSIDTDRVSKLTGTIKDHSEYNGAKQNILTRCKVEYNPKEKRQTVKRDVAKEYMDALDEFLKEA